MHPPTAATITALAVLLGSAIAAPIPTLLAADISALSNRSPTATAPRTEPLKRGGDSFADILLIPEPGNAAKRRFDDGFEELVEPGNAAKRDIIGGFEGIAEPGNAAK